MKRSIIGVLTVFLLSIFTFSYVSAYVPTQKDDLIIQSLEKRIDSMKVNDSLKLEKISMKLEILLGTLNKDSREYYILGGIYDLIVGKDIVEQEVVIDEPETSNECGYGTLHVGSRGGCYYMNSSDKKSYVDRSCCSE